MVRFRDFSDASDAFSPAEESIGRASKQPSNIYNQSQHFRVGPEKMNDDGYSGFFVQCWQREKGLLD